MEEKQMGGVPEKPHASYLSRYEIGEMVTLNFHESGLIPDCKVDGVRLEESKVYYDILVPIRSGVETLIEKVDSICISDNKTT